MKYVRPLERVQRRLQDELGAKGARLAALHRAGFAIPRTEFLLRRACDEFFSENLAKADLPSELIRDPKGISSERLDAIREQLASAPISPLVVAEIQKCYHRMREHGVRAFAVRSSSSVEDQVDLSGAGLAFSAIGVEREHELLQAIKDVWLSLLSESLHLYLRRRRASKAPAMAVIIQELVEAKAAGVMFTVDPVGPESGELVISAARGLGMPVVDGHAAADLIRVDRRRRREREYTLGTQPEMMRFRSGDGVIAVEETLREERVLGAHEVEELVDLGLRAERQFSVAQDIEWALDGRGFWVLQSRPITTVDAPRATVPSRSATSAIDDTLWSRTNVGEALSGAASPLTWSVLRRFAESGFRTLFDTLGCAFPKDAEFVGNFRGRIYLNLSALNVVLAQVPLYRPESMVALGGGTFSETLTEDAKEVSSRAYLLRLPLTTARLLRQSKGLAERSAEFLEFFDREIARLESIPTAALQDDRLARVWRDAERLLSSAGEHLVRIYAHLFLRISVLHEVFTRLGDEAKNQRIWELLSNVEGVDSAAPARMLRKAAELAIANEPLCAQLANGEIESFADLPAGPVKVQLDELLQRYGFRGFREAELLSPRWSERPDDILSMLVSQIRGQKIRATQAKSPPNAEDWREQLIAELTPLAQVPIRFVVDQSLEYIRHRELQRARVTRVLAVLRRFAKDASGRIRSAQPEAGDDAAFFLSVSELLEWLGRRDSVGPVIRRRRRQYEHLRALPDPPATFSGSLDVVEPPVQSDASDVYSGLAVSPGEASGRLRFVANAQDAQTLAPNDIALVSVADVAMATALVGAKGVIAELGGPLSHAAIVLREFAVPAVFNVAGLIGNVKDGELVHLNGLTGRIEIDRDAAI